MQDDYTMKYANCFGNFVLAESNTQRILKKYYTPTGRFKFTEKLSGDYLAFKTPDNKLYLLDEQRYNEKFIVKNRVRPSINEMEVDDIFTVSNADYSGLLQYKTKLTGEYYLLIDGSKSLILSGIDLAILTKLELDSLLANYTDRKEK